MESIEPIVDEAALAHLGARAAEAEHIGIDTESNSMHVYRERICLVQVAIDDEHFVIDPFAFSSARAAIEPLVPVLEDPARQVVLHGGEYDVAVFKRECDVALRGVFDTQQAASMLGWARTGLGSLVDSICGVKLDKAYAKHDWGRRPLQAAPLEYALDDVRHLRPLAAELAVRVREADLGEEVALANEAVEGAAPHSQSFDPAGFWRIKGVKELDPEGRALLQRLWAWREAAAERADRPAGRLLNSRQLLALARRKPRSERDLARAGIPGVVRRREGEALLRTIEAEGTELLPRPRAAEPSPELRKREKQLKGWRRKEAERRGVPLAVVLPGRALAWIVEHPEADWSEAPQLGHKRLARYEAEIRRCLAGA